MLARRDPFREFMNLRNAMNQLVEDSFLSRDFDMPARSWSLPLDVVESEDEYVVKASVPGMEPDDLEITFNNNVLTIKGERKAEEEKEGKTYHLRERRYGFFSRSISLPSDVDANRIDAQYDKGILTLRLPKAEEAKPKRIQIHAGEAKPVLEG